MTKFNPGDRVAVYGVDGNFEPRRIQGTVTGYAGTDMLYVEGPTVINGNIWDLSMPHVKQCRKLKPKAVKVPRTIWVTKDALRRLYTGDEYSTCTCTVSKEKIVSHDVEFVEVIKK